MEIQARRASFEVAHFAVFSSTNPAKYEPDAQASELIGDVILAAKTSGSATISLACAAGLYQVCNFKTRKRGVGTIPRLRVELVLKPLVQLLAAISSGQAGSLCHNEEPTVIFRSMLKK